MKSIVNNLMLNTFNVFLIYIYSIFCVFAQNPSWPVNEVYNQINCTFAEKHTAFHGGIDIHIANNNVIKSTLDGIVENDAYSSNFMILRHGLLKEDDFNSHIKLVRYGDYINPLPTITGLNRSQESPSFVNQGNDIGIISSGGHLHFEMWIRDCTNGCDWYLVNPLKNRYPDYHNLPPGYADTYEVELNDIILEPQDNKSGIIFTDGNGLERWHFNSCKIHKKDRPDSQGSIFASNSSKITVFGSILPTIHVRDTKVTDGENSIGEGLGIHQYKYYINNQLKYHVEFDELQQVYKNKWSSYFNSKYNTITNNSILYGNHDYMKLFRLDSDEYLAPHKVIDRGIWNTRILQGSTRSNSDIPTKVKYPDGIYNLVFYVSDAAGNSDNANNEIYIDNFLPYLTEVNIKYNGDPLHQTSRVGDEGSAKADDGYIMNQIHEYPIGSGLTLPNTLTIEVKTSEPMQNVKMAYVKGSLYT